MRTVKRPGRGFTLIELMVVVAIIAILTAIALPIYTQYIQRGARTDARGTLLLAAQWLERNRNESNSYSTTPGGGNLVLPAAFALSPASGTLRYSIALGPNPSATTFALTATPTGPQAGDACGAFRVDQTGSTCLVNPAAEDNGSCAGQIMAGPLYDQCWGR